MASSAGRDGVLPTQDDEDLSAEALEQAHFLVERKEDDDQHRSKKNMSKEALKEMMMEKGIKELECNGKLLVLEEKKEPVATWAAMSAWLADDHQIQLSPEECQDSIRIYKLKLAQKQTIVKHVLRIRKLKRKSTESRKPKGDAKEGLEETGADVIVDGASAENAGEEVAAPRKKKRKSKSRDGEEMDREFVEIVKA